MPVPKVLPTYSVNPNVILPGLVNTAALLFAVSGYTMWLSAAGRSRTKVQGYAIMLTLTMFLVNVIGQLWDGVSFLRPLSVFYYYQPQAINMKGVWTVDPGVAISGHHWVGANVILVLGLVGAIGYAMALRTFVKPRRAGTAVTFRASAAEFALRSERSARRQLRPRSPPADPPNVGDLGDLGVLTPADNGKIDVIAHGRRQTEYRVSRWSGPLRPVGGAVSPDAPNGRLGFLRPRGRGRPGGDLPEQFPRRRRVDQFQHGHGPRRPKLVRGRLRAVDLGQEVIDPLALLGRHLSFRASFR